jgi:hypothetical protein
VTAIGRRLVGNRGIEARVRIGAGLQARSVTRLGVTPMA